MLCGRCTVVVVAVQVVIVCSVEVGVWVKLSFDDVDVDEGLVGPSGMD